MGRSLYVSVTQEQGRQLQALAKTKRTSSSELVRRAVEHYLTRMAKRQELSDLQVQDSYRWRPPRPHESENT